MGLGSRLLHLLSNGSKSLRLRCCRLGKRLNRSQGGDSFAAFFLTRETARSHGSLAFEERKGQDTMRKSHWHQTASGQTRQEVFLVILVCAVALIATLSVFVPGLRHLWTSLGRLLIR